MAGDDTLASLAQAFARLDNALGGGVQRAALTRLGVDARKDVAKEVGRDLGDDQRMSGWGKFKFGSGFELLNDHSFELEARPKGPWQVLENGRKGKAGAYPKKAAYKVYRTPVGPRTASQGKGWSLGPTRGKGTFARAVTVIDRETIKRYDRHLGTVISKEFR